MTRRRSVAAVLAGATLVLASCTTVPESSAPSIVRPVPLGEQDRGEVITPPPGAEPRTIVQGFLQANGLNDPNHNSARSFLTSEQKTKWSDSLVTVVDQAVPGNAVGGKVVVTGHQIGSFKDGGPYESSLSGDGTGAGATTISETFGMKQVNGQWRIDSLPTGLLISAAQFQQYQQRKLYYFDAAEERLVPYPLYTQLYDPGDLTVWLIARLAQQPPSGLQTGLPNQTDPSRVRVDLANDSGTGVTKIDIPGASQLDSTNRNRLAAQIAATLGQVSSLGDIQITDSGAPVRIPAVHGTSFTAGQLSGLFEVATPPARWYYVNGGAIYTQSGHRVPGKGASAYGLTSVALRTEPSSDAMQLAGVFVKNGEEHLDIGTTTQLYPTTVRGVLSRPAWAPDLDEAWIGDGASLLRVTTAGKAYVVPMDAGNAQAGGTVAAVRFSPEGARVALVLKNSDGVSRAWVGAVVRGSSQVRVTGLTPISPPGVAVRDVAWNDQLKLFAIGTDSRTSGWGVYEVQCDGSLWTLSSSTNLPQAPDSVTVASGSPAAVSAGTTVWRQQGTSWQAPVGEETHGINPVYVE